MNSSADMEEVCYLEKNNQFVNKNDVLAKKKKKRIFPCGWI